MTRIKDFAFNADSASGYLHHAIELSHQRKYWQCMQVLLYMADEYPNNARVWHELSKRYRATADDALAMEVLEKAHSLNPHDKFIINDLAKFKTEKKQYEEAEDLYITGCRNNPKDKFLITGLGNVYQNIGELGLAAVCFDKALSLDPRDAYSARRSEELFSRYGISSTPQLVEVFKERTGLKPQVSAESPYVNKGIHP